MYMCIHKCICYGEVPGQRDLPHARLREHLGGLQLDPRRAEVRRAALIMVCMCVSNVVSIIIIRIGCMYMYAHRDI